MLHVLEPRLRGADFVEQVRVAAHVAATRAGDLDEDGSFPSRDIQSLAAIGALKAPLPPGNGGLGLGPLRQVPFPYWMRCAGLDTAACHWDGYTKVT